MNQVHELGGHSGKSFRLRTVMIGYGYDAVGNVTGASDINTSGGSVMGTWTYAYDTLNRLVSGHNTATTPASIQYANMYGCWAYDDFGNRTANDPLWTTACPAQESSLTPTDTYNTNNQMDVATKSYDPSGNMTEDSSTGNTYLYDGEGRVCAVSSTPVLGFTTMTGYVYDAEGTRVAKGTITSMSCDPSVNGLMTANNETDYVLGPGGEQVTELAQDANGTMNWQRTYVYAGGAMIATYDPNPDNQTQPLPSFRLTDWLGTLRATTDSYGVAQGTCTGLPYGDGQACSGDIPDNHHFTGKERDAESGNDYFGARYYASTMGRWLSPDWSAKEAPVPYAKMDNPQSLNLYIYVLNNPLSHVDRDGHGCHKFLGVTVCLGDPLPPPPPNPAPPPATIAAYTKTGVVVEYHQATGKIETLDAAGNKKDLGTGHAGEGTGRNNPDAQNRKDTDPPRGNAGPLPRGEYTIGPQQDNQTSSGKTLYASMSLTDNPSNNMDGRDSNSFLIHGGELSKGCVVADRKTRDAIAISGTNTLEVER